MLLVSKKLNRYEKIRSSLADLTYATREQLRIINGLGGVRNANRILLDMERMGYVKSVRYDRKVYYVDTRLKRSEIQHILMRNNLFIKFGMPSDWKKEVPLRINGEVLLIPDAMFKRKGELNFVEIELMQAMKVNYDKIKRYKEISSIIFSQYNHTPTIIFHTVSDSRRLKLEKECEKLGVKYMII